jgi:hypothetical protein
MTCCRRWCWSWGSGRRCWPSGSSRRWRLKCGNQYSTTRLSAEEHPRTACAAAPPFSSDLGSEGSGPSMAHRLVSYFERIKDSILLSRQRANRLQQGSGHTDREAYGQLSGDIPSTGWRDGSPISGQTGKGCQLQLAKACRAATATHVHLFWRPDIQIDTLDLVKVSLYSVSSSPGNQPLLICVPMDLWIPEHRIHKKTPLPVNDFAFLYAFAAHKFQEAQRASSGSDTAQTGKESSTHHSFCSLHSSCCQVA